MFLHHILSVIQIGFLFEDPIKPIGWNYFLLFLIMLKFGCYRIYAVNIRVIRNYEEFLDLSQKQHWKSLISIWRVKNAVFMLVACTLLMNFVPLFMGLIHYETPKDIYLQWPFFIGFAIIDLFIGAKAFVTAISINPSAPHQNHNKHVYETDTHTCVLIGDREILIPKPNAFQRLSDHPDHNEMEREEIYLKR